ASLISHNLRCIPAYTHQIPTGFFFKPKGRFFWYAFGIYKPKEPSLWFVVLCGLIEIRHATALTTGAKHGHR
ncbi:MAG: hypothetical protein SPJ60_07255, partial [Sodaliphilus sp.]|nr:hypothetical protein [Sodaliphilus sp.]